MDEDKLEIAKLLAAAGLEIPAEVGRLGEGEFNVGYRVKTVSGDEYCVRIAKYDNESGLAREADAIGRIPDSVGPKLVYYSGKTEPIDKPWIIESFIDGQAPKRLSVDQFRSMGVTLARTHSVLAPDHDIVDKGEVTGSKTELWQYLTWCCRDFYSPRTILTDLPDIRLTRLAQKIKLWLDDQQTKLNFDNSKHLLHKDITPGNLLVNDKDEVFLIDWELRDFGDPMTDFATGFWDDIEFNNGKWRIVLTEEEQAALYAGYESVGGIIDKDKIKMWTVFDKLVAAIYLCFRLHTSTDPINDDQRQQYTIDLDNVVNSLNRLF